MAISDESAYEFSLNTGLDANKPADPAAGDIYISTDMGKLNICFKVGVWASQPLPLPITIGDDSTLNFNGKPLVTPDGSAISLTQAATFTINEDVFGIMPNPNGNTSIISTSPTLAGVTDKNIIGAQSRVPQNAATIELRLNNTVTPKGTTVYVYSRAKSYSSMESLLGELSTFVPFASNIGYLSPTYRRFTKIYAEG